MERTSAHQEDRPLFDFTGEDREILNEFITESKESIEELETLLIELESGVQSLDKLDSETIDKIFRTFHSLKGSAGFIGLSVTANVTHHAETLLDLIRKGKLKLEKAHISLFLELCDFFLSLLDHIKETLDEKDFEAPAEQFIERLNEMIGSKAGESEPLRKEKAKRKTGSSKNTGKSVSQKNTDSGTSSNEPITPQTIDHFVAGAKKTLDKLKADLLQLEENPQNKNLIESTFREFHSLKDNAALLNYSDIHTLCQRAESFLEEVRNGKIEASSEQFSILLQILDFLRDAIMNLEQGKPATIMSMDGILSLLDDFLLIPGNDDREPPAEEKAPADMKKKPNDDRKDNQEKPPHLKDIAPSDKPTSSLAPPKPTEKPQNGEWKSSASGKTNGEFIRVDVNKLNKLMDLVGEIVIAESMVSQHPDVAGREMPEFEKAVLHLQKNIRELQELATSLRMIPLSGLFRKMIRLVRDLSTRSNKKAELAILGGETEVDRSVIEHISDPLVHIIRNAVDHGIEPPAEREAAGKSPVGTITLEAKQVGGEIRINISDDGRGLNREKLLAKAIEKGIISGSGDDWPDEKVWNLIFAPGFSTAENVTDISGRGVGMDVVQRNIEKIRGRVSVESHPGIGTTIILRIPLTTAIIDGMIIRVHHSLYAIPMLDIKESLIIHPSQVVSLVDGQEVVKIRDQLYPVIRIHDFHSIRCEKKELWEGILVVVENGGQSLCLYADEIIGQKQLVIKALPEYIGQTEGVSGCAILGNGDICLILDIDSIIKIAENQTQLEEQEYAV